MQKPVSKLKRVVGRPYDRRVEAFDILNKLPYTHEIGRLRIIIREAFSLYDALEFRHNTRVAVDSRKMDSFRARLLRQIRTNRLQRLAALQTAGEVFMVEYKRLSGLVMEGKLGVDIDDRHQPLARIAFMQTCQSIRRSTDIDIEKVFDLDREELREKAGAMLK